MEYDAKKWVGVPFKHRYASVEASRDLVRAMRNYDDLLDLKFYIPTEKWHVVRYLYSRNYGKFTRVWELDDKPEIGLRKEPGMWILDALKAADMQAAAANRVEEVDLANKMIEEANDREISEQCKDLSRDMRKPLQRLYDEGVNSQHKGYF